MENKNKCNYGNLCLFCVQCCALLMYVNYRQSICFCMPSSSPATYSFGNLSPGVVNLNFNILDPAVTANICDSCLEVCSDTSILVGVAVATIMKAQFCENTTVDSVLKIVMGIGSGVGAVCLRRAILPYRRSMNLQSTNDPSAMTFIQVPGDYPDNQAGNQAPEPSNQAGNQAPGIVPASRPRNLEMQEIQGNYLLISNTEEVSAHANSPRNFGMHEAEVQENYLLRSNAEEVWAQALTTGPQGSEICDTATRRLRKCRTMSELNIVSDGSNFNKTVLDRYHLDSPATPSPSSVVAMDISELQSMARSLVLNAVSDIMESAL